MAKRLQQHHRTAVAALLLCFVVATMLISASGLLTNGDGNRPGPQVAPVGAGITRTVSSAAEWDAAVAAAAPGDVIRLTATIPQRLIYRGNTDGSGGGGASGTATEPIVITADPGVWVDPGNQSSGFGALDVFTVDHVHVVGVSVRNAQFGIRCLQCRGSAGAPLRIADNTVTSIGHAGINVAGHWTTRSPSSHISVEGNVVAATGRTGEHYGEGVYVGYGSVEWIDETSDVTVANNDISETTAEGVDVKPGTRNVVVEGNFIHDLAPRSGGAISAHYVNLTPNPKPWELDKVVVRNNLIWNVNLAGVSGSNDWAIWVGHGGVDIIDNTIWGLRNGSSTRAVRVRATQDFGSHPITIQGNTFWTTHGWVAEGSPSGASNVAAAGNRGVDPSSSEITVDESAFVGPVPALGSSGSADDGGGPGSAFALAGTETLEVASADPTTTTSTTVLITTATTEVPTTTAAPTTTAPTTAPTSAVPTSAAPTTVTTSGPTTTAPNPTVATTTAPTTASEPATTSVPGAEAAPPEPSGGTQTTQTTQVGGSGAAPATVPAQEPTSGGSAADAGEPDTLAFDASNSDRGGVSSDEADRSGQRAPGNRGAGGGARPWPLAGASTVIVSALVGLSLWLLRFPFGNQSS